MLSQLRIILLALVFACIGLCANAQDVRSDVEIADIAGHWRIEVIDRPNDDFKGTAFIPKAKGKTVTAETITEDKCCGGRNHARVLQKSRITIDADGNINVSSSVVKFLLREEEIEMSYSPDDFELRQVDDNTLIGTANGFTPIRWVRDEINLS